MSLSGNASSKNVGFTHLFFHDCFKKYLKQLKNILNFKINLYFIKYKKKNFKNCFSELFPKTSSNQALNPFFFFGVMSKVHVKSLEYDFQ